MTNNIARIVLLFSLFIATYALEAQDQNAAKEWVEENVKDAEIKYRIKEPTEINKTEKGITCKQVRVVDVKNDYIGNSFIYGQRIKVCFDNMKGFVPSNGKAYPSMFVTIKDLDGKEISRFEKIGESTCYYYNDKDGIKDFGAYFTIASPIFSGKTYVFSAEVTDTKTNGNESFLFEFAVLPNKYLSVESFGVSCTEAAICYYDSDKFFYLPYNKLDAYAKNYLIVYEPKGFSENKYGDVDLSVRVDMVDPKTDAVVKNILTETNYVTSSDNLKDLRVKLDYLPIVNTHNAIGKVTWSDNLSEKKLIVYIDF